jgi:parallel beta-helix repeat protein
MKSLLKANKTKILIIVIVTVFLEITSNYLFYNFGISELYSRNNNDLVESKDYLKTAKISGRINIYRNSGWVDAENAGICTGSGIYSDPYVIEDLVIDCAFYGDGIYIYKSDVFFRIENCTVFNSGEGDTAGIHIRDSKNGLLFNNTVYSNRGDGICLRNSDNNTVLENKANNNNNYGIHIYGRNNNISGNLLSGCGFSLSGTVEDISTNEIYPNNLVNDKPICYYISESGLESTNFTNAGQILLVNCSNSTISGLTSSKGGEISLYHSDHNLVSNNNADGNKHGIYLYYSAHNIISGNSLYNNRRSGIKLYYSDDNIVLGNGVSHHTYWYGIYLRHSDNNDIIGNNLINNGDAINLENSANNNISGNIASYEQGVGLNLDFNCNNNYISNNLFINNWFGINIYDSSGNTITGNTVDQNYIGIRLTYQCTNNYFSENTAERNEEQGIYLSNSNGNIFFNNTIKSNDKGVELTESNRNTFTNNTVHWNTNGIELSESNDNDIIENNFFRNTNGIVLMNSHDNNILDNIANENWGQGIELYRSHRNNISGNSANNHIFHGITLISSNNNTITGNTANFNEYGIYLVESNFTIVSGNTLIQNQICIVEEFCEGNEFYNNGACKDGFDNTLSGYNIFYMIIFLTFVFIILAQRVKRVKSKS